MTDTNYGSAAFGMLCKCYHMRQCHLILFLVYDLRTGCK